jgi:uncharacterized protein
VVTDCSLGNHDWLHWRLTTYSSFNYETSRLLEEGAVGAAALNAGVTIIGAFIAGGLGLLCANNCSASEEDVMRVLDGNQFLVRILLGESDRFHHTPLSSALLERLRREGFAGATVIHGIAGFGASSVIHTASLGELSTDLPVLIEVIDDEAHVEKLLPILDEMVTGGSVPIKKSVCPPIRTIRPVIGTSRTRSVCSAW